MQHMRRSHGVRMRGTRGVGAVAAARSVFVRTGHTVEAAGVMMVENIGAAGTESSMTATAAMPGTVIKVAREGARGIGTAAGTEVETGTGTGTGEMGTEPNVRSPGPAGMPSAGVTATGSTASSRRNRPRQQSQTLSGSSLAMQP